MLQVRGRAAVCLLRDLSLVLVGKQLTWPDLKLPHPAPAPQKQDKQGEGNQSLTTSMTFQLSGLCFINNPVISFIALSVFVNECRESSSVSFHSVVVLD